LDHWQVSRVRLIFSTDSRMTITRTNSAGLYPNLNIIITYSSINIMNRISVTDWLVFILMAVMLLEINFKDMTVFNWIACIVALIWFVLFIVKLIIPKGRDKNE